MNDPLYLTCLQQPSHYQNNDGKSFFLIPETQSNTRRILRSCACNFASADSEINQIPLSLRVDDSLTVMRNCVEIRMAKGESVKRLKKVVKSVEVGQGQCPCRRFLFVYAVQLWFSDLHYFSFNTLLALQLFSPRRQLSSPIPIPLSKPSSRHRSSIA